MAGLRQGLSQKLLQKLSPQQIQLMKLLQLPLLSLEQRVKEELEANPALEEGEEPIETVEDADSLADELSGEDTKADDDFDMQDYINDDDIPDYKLSSPSYDPDDDNADKGSPVRVTKSFHEHVESQLGLQEFDQRQFLMALQIVGSIDEDGYLRRELFSIMDDLAFSQNLEVDESELEAVLMVIQTLDPPGIGARTLQESLRIQIRAKDGDSESIELAEIILEKHFDSFSKKHYEKLQTQLGVDEESLKMALEEILKLNPKPGSAYAQDTSKVTQYITPDFMIKNVNGQLELSLNGRNAPELRISKEYRNMMEAYNESKKKDKAQKDAILFIKQKIDGAKWFIEAIQERQNTLLNSMQAILDYQYNYFLTGDISNLKPMILKDIAEITKLDLSTISRVANSKYVQTEFGTFPLKAFFSESMQTESGEEVSTLEVKNILKELIEEEDKGKPLSDQQLTIALKDKGYNIARRTVAKYREQLNLPVARLRKEL